MRIGAGDRILEIKPERIRQCCQVVSLKLRRDRNPEGKGEGQIAAALFHDLVKFQLGRSGCTGIVLIGSFSRAFPGSMTRMRLDFRRFYFLRTWSLLEFLLVEKIFVLENEVGALIRLRKGRQGGEGRGGCHQGKAEHRCQCAPSLRGAQCLARGVKHRMEPCESLGRTAGSGWRNILVLNEGNGINAHLILPHGPQSSAGASKGIRA